MRIQAAYNNTSEIELEGSDIGTVEEPSLSLYPIGTKVAKQFEVLTESLLGLKVKCSGMVSKMISIGFCTVMVTLKTWKLVKYVMQWTTTECTYSHRKRQSQKLRLLQLVARCCPLLSMLQ
jgi:hypothetical protein